MTIGASYFFGALAAFLYAALCVYIGLKRPAALFKITKMKLGKNRSDETITKILYVVAGVAAVVGIVVLYLGVMAS